MQAYLELSFCKLEEVVMTGHVGKKQKNILEITYEVHILTGSLTSTPFTNQ